jgi:hypothetical protein
LHTKESPWKVADQSGRGVGIVCNMKIVKYCLEIKLHECYPAKSIVRVQYKCCIGTVPCGHINHVYFILPESLSVSPSGRSTGGSIYTRTSA